LTTLKRNQQTLSQPVTLSGTGLHTGVETTLTLRPAPAGSGRSIHLAGEDGATVIPLTAATTGDHMHRTVAEADGARVHTIEHLLAALAGCGVDNVEIHLTAPEPPGADGSARPLAEAILEAGLEEQNAPAPVATLREPLTVHDGKGAVITALPSDEGLRLTYTVDYPQSRLARGVAECLVTPESFLAELAPARTFCMEAEVEPMRAAGCGQGASYQNTLVLREDEVVENEMRLPDEPARHKLLDLLGDLRCWAARSACTSWPCAAGTPSTPASPRRSSAG
jgi:UDP-3-O-acyl N-acetylglucosamine deacetylase